MRTIGIPLRKLDTKLASVRYRILIPATHIDENAYRYVFGQPGDITLCLKHSMTLSTVSELPGQIIWDVADDHFDSATLGDYYRTMPDLVDVVTCTTPTLAARIKTETGVSPVVIPDPVEYEKQYPSVSAPEKLFWYGHTSNLQALFDLKLDRPVLIVTNAKESWCFPFSAENMRMGYSWCDAVIIPIQDTGAGPRKNAKSSNRMTEAINAGRFVIANPMPAYEGWGMWLGDIEEGIEWMRNNPREALNKLILAQEMVTEKLAPQVIARQWKTLFDSILDAEQNDGTDTSTSILPTIGLENSRMSAQT